jgi:hypothetical protein
LAEACLGLQYLAVLTCKTLPWALLRKTPQAKMTCAKPWSGSSTPPSTQPPAHHSLRKPPQPPLLLLLLLAAAAAPWRLVLPQLQYSLLLVARRPSKSSQVQHRCVEEHDLIQVTQAGIPRPRCSSYCELFCYIAAAIVS